MSKLRRCTVRNATTSTALQVLAEMIEGGEEVPEPLRALIAA
jgi:hypothetical protein